MLPLSETEIEAIIRPENGLEMGIIQDEAWLRGAFWGKPRYGHPEGKIILHIREVLDNVDRATQDLALRSRLRMVAITHDTFKYLEDRTLPRKLARHHAVHAYKFSRKYINDAGVLNTILLHDNVYYAWQAMTFDRPDIADRLLEAVYRRLREDMQLYYLFFKCDTLTGDKTLLPLEWFEQVAAGFDKVAF